MVTEDQMKKLSEIETRDDYEPLEYWSQKINPKLKGIDPIVHARKSILLTLASSQDRNGQRKRINTLLYGPPGTGKSALILWVAEKLGKEFVTHRTTDVGFTGYGRGKKVVPGALPRNDNDTLLVEELDKIDPQEREGLLESLSAGYVKITVGDHTKRLNARTRVVATANEIDSFSQPLLDRFDIKIELPQLDAQQQKEVMHYVIDNWEKRVEGYGGGLLSAYLSTLRGTRAKISEDMRELCKKAVDTYIGLVKDDLGTTRGKQALIRIAQAIAKLNRRDVRPRDIAKAVEIFDCDLNITQINTIKRVIEENSDWEMED